MLEALEHQGTNGAHGASEDDEGAKVWREGRLLRLKSQRALFFSGSSSALPAVACPEHADAAIVLLPPEWREMLQRAWLASRYWDGGGFKAQDSSGRPPFLAWNPAAGKKKQSRLEESLRPLNRSKAIWPDVTTPPAAAALRDLGGDRALQLPVALG